MTRENIIDEDDKASERVHELATTVVAREQAVRPYLDTLTEKSLTGDTEALRDSLARFRATNEDLFTGLLMTLHGSDGFFEDVESSDAPDETVESLEALEERYGHLVGAFEVVYVENRYGIKNGSPGLSTSRAYNAAEALPLMNCEVTAKGTDVGEFRIPPSQALALADTLLTHASYVVRDTVNNEQGIAPHEVEGVRDRLVDLEATLEEAQAILADDGIDDAKTPPPANAADDDGFDGEGSVDDDDEIEDDPTGNESYYYFH